MKIAFLCTSLAPGKDGVGDYSRRLAAACSAEGHACRLIALNERDGTANGPAESDELLLPAAWTWERRTAALVAELAEFGPDWLSWQIVPYGFDPKGLLPADVFRLAAAVRPWRQQVMLHELWIGIARSESWRHRWVGSRQKRRLLSFLACVSPRLLHTSNAAYQAVLRWNGWLAALLPLFGNIPIVKCSREEAAASLRRLDETLLPARSRWIVAIFGTIHPQWNHRETLSWLEGAGRAAGREIMLLTIGRSGARGEARMALLAAENPSLRVLASGPQEAGEVSRLLQAADCGLATHPWALLGKSGSTVTFLEHGLPVLVPRDDWHFRSSVPTPGPDDPLLARLTDLSPGHFAAWLARRRPPAGLLPAVARRFLDSLEGAGVLP